MAFQFNFHYTDPKESPFWDDSYEEIVRSYPEDQQAQVRDDLMNARNCEKYGVKLRLVGPLLAEDFSQIPHGDGEVKSDEQQEQGEEDN